MRSRSVILFAAFSALVLPALAQEPGPGLQGPVVPPPSPPGEVVPAPDGMIVPWPPMLIPHEEADPADRLDDLFAELKGAPDEESAIRLERRIVVTMMNSGSETVDLLMSWATESIMEEDYPLALDFLDSVVMMAPEFAEGWNRRATVHFRMGDFGPALDDIQRTLTLEPRHFQAIAGLGIILRQLDRPEQALTAFHRALEIHPFLEGVADAIKDLEEDYSRDI
jgi:tetratricopeptide (TPR) repeat protein